MSAEEGNETQRTHRWGAQSPRPRRVETRRLEGETSESALVAVPPAYLGLRREEMIWAALAHGSILLTMLLGIISGGLIIVIGPVVPALIWYTHRGKSEYVVDQARQATVFQLAGIVFWLAVVLSGAVLITVGWLINAALTLMLIGLLLFPFMLLLTLAWAVFIVTLPIALVAYGCYAAVEAYNGRSFRYYWITDLIDRYHAQV